MHSLHSPETCNFIEIRWDKVQPALHSQIRHLGKVDGFIKSSFVFKRKLKKSLKTVNVHLYTTDSREMSDDDSAQTLPELRLAGNATHARSPFSLSRPGTEKSGLSFDDIIMTCRKVAG